jgi:hypothetical protein
MHENILAAFGDCKSLQRAGPCLLAVSDEKYTKLGQGRFYSSNHLVEPSYCLILSIGRPTSGVVQRAMREAEPHARGVSKARQGNSKKVGCSQNPINCSEPFPCPLPLFGKNDVKLGRLGSVA